MTLGAHAQGPVTVVILCVTVCVCVCVFVCVCVCVCVKGVTVQWPVLPPATGVKILTHQIFVLDP